MNVEWVEILAANGVLALGSVLQAATGLGAGLVVVPLLALISLEFVPGPVILAALALAWLMAWQGRTVISYTGMPLLLGGLLFGMILGTSVLSQVSLDRLGVLFGVLILLAISVSVFGWPGLCPVSWARLPRSVRRCWPCCISIKRARCYAPRSVYSTSSLR